MVVHNTFSRNGILYTDIVFGFYAMIEGENGWDNKRRQSQLNINHDLQLFSPNACLHI